MNFRFRKSYDILGKFLRFTVSKRGVSLNLRAGLFSRSWGTRGTSTTVDMPGTSGIFWRGERRRHAADLDDIDRAEHRQRRNLKLGAAIITVLAAYELARLHLHLGEDCSLTGHPHVALLVLVALQAAALHAYRSLHPAVVLVLTVAIGWAQLRAFGMIALPSVHCS